MSDLQGRLEVLLYYHIHGMRIPPISGCICPFYVLGKCCIPHCIGVNLPFRLPEYPSNCGSAITSVLILVSPPTYSNRDCCGRPEFSVMCSGDIQGFTEKQLKIWLEGATNIPFISLWTDLRRLGSDLRLKLFQHKSEGCYLEVPGNNNPRIEPPSTILETEEQRNQRNHEEELEKARKEKRPKIYNEGRPGNKKPRIDPPSTILEIEEQRNHEELAKKYIFKNSLELKNTKKKSPLLYVMTLRDPWSKV
ncbi:12980_t:CDS:2 [Funneliformis mosseae]|uniref:12980_t:CDS:1 n=1 Tax=Funneliformis mosseae TaxID=27381 RepID=A0A9N8WG33_FUNMO|nr:12980_t:CDS:2 [Funneliformis mosseae]